MQNPVLSLITTARCHSKAVPDTAALRTIRLLEITQNLRNIDSGM